MHSLRRRARTATAAAGLAALGITGLAFPQAAHADEIPIIHIGEVQGSIGDDDTDFASPLHNETVRVQGVVTQLTLEGNGNSGFFVQERADATDGDPNSSDGIFVYNGTFDSLRTATGSPAAEELGPRWTVAVGDEIVLEAKVGTYYGNVQFSGGSAYVYDVVDTGLDPLEAVEAAEVDPPDDAADAERYFRRHLGMQLTVPADSVVTAGRDVFGTDGEVWAMRGDHEVAQREDYSQRAYRDAHPLDNVPGEAFDDGNGYLFTIGSFGIKATAGNADAMIAPAKTYDVITEAATGGVYLTFGKYTVNVAENLDLESGPQPAENHPVEPAGRGEAAIGSYNVENLYDTRDNPNSECDDLADPGCVDPDDPEGNVDPPFDYVPASYAEYEARMGRMAAQITGDLHSPDVLMVQETETQDVCEANPEWTPDADLGADRLVCDLENTGEANAHADGQPDSLQELALIIAESGGAEYTAAGDLDAGDTRGIMTAFLYRADDVELLDARRSDPVLGSDPEVDYGTEADEINADVQNPKALNASLPEDVLEQCSGSGVFACNGSDVFSRPAQVGLFRFTYEKPGRDKHADVYLVDNHFSSGPDRRVLHRTEQAAYLAAISDAILSDDRRAKVLAAGDFNVFPRPDDPFAPGQTIAGDWVGPSDQLAPMYEDSGLSSLYDTMLDEHPAAAYSYTYMGQTQTLDQMWASPWLQRRIEDVASAHINADYPADAPGEEPAYGAYGVSDHDPEVVTLDLKHLCR
ncbi:hypothetical protein [Glycomyces arizonensis]|uniref:hypothetical protein n=1 Tax=Glycomyces arizonensis TaxID=256035 RepID=UPI0004033E61|nr:hypothetical protein [Glycomyces arizonensis]